MNTYTDKSRTPVRNVASRILVALTFVALSPAITKADLVFSDDFTSSTLNPAWQVLPGQGSYTTGGGYLRYFNDGPTASTTGWYNPALTLALPFTGTNWEIDTKVTYNLDWCLSGTYTGPPTPNPGCSSGAQGPEVLVKFNPAVTTSSYGGADYAGPDYMSIERNTDAYYGSNELVASYASVSSPNLLAPGDMNINNNIADGAYFFQIIRDGGTLTVKYSSDGSSYATAFSTSLSDPTST